jgi:SAM-dependent methyltransferase
MDRASQYVASLVAPYRPSVPLEELVQRLNGLFHSVEAPHYDRRHQEIIEELPPVWRAMIGRAEAAVAGKTWSILDFGCGTGFEAQQVVSVLQAERIASLVCYDPSAEMLAACRRKLAPQCSRAAFTDSLDEVRKGPRRFNVLLTNSLLHHMPRPWETVESLAPLLEPGTIWLQGHEPSRRFFQNAECLAAYTAYVRDYRWRRFLSPKKYAGRLGRWLRGERTPADATARRSHAEGLFHRRPPASVVGWLVDYHVAHNAEQARAGKGFDFREMEEQFRARWQLHWAASYSFMGPVGESALAPRWKRLAMLLEQKYPQDGADFCCVWRRI